MNNGSDPKRAMLRHTLATLAYRAGKSMRETPEGFETLRPHEGLRTPAQILAHMGDLIEWAHSMAIGQQTWKVSEPLEWDAERERFFSLLERFDGLLASDEMLHAEPERLFQGPIADALTHVGQIALLRRLAESPVRGENYFIAAIEPGRVGAEQTAPAFEF